MNKRLVASELLKIAKLLAAAPKNNLDAKTRKAINNELAKISTHNAATRYEKIPLDTAFGALKKYGVVPLQEDRTEWSGFLTGKEGRASISLGRDVGKGGDHQHDEFDNAMLIMTWYRENQDNSKYEFICYVS